MWLTAFVLKCYVQASNYIYIDDRELSLTVQWILSHQRSDGSFPSVGRLINRELQSGSHSHILLTAFVAVTLTEVNKDINGIALALQRARNFLESNMDNVADSYTMALTAYALSVMESSHSEAAFKRLLGMAVNNEGITYWKHLNENPDDFDDMHHQPGMTAATAADIETTAYALLTMIRKKNIVSALSVVKWLSRQRNPLGGFISTQASC